jgi:hypothetical protein
MRKLLISILLASAAASPAFAQDYGDHDRGRHHEQQQNDRQERQQAREQVRVERPQFQVREQQDNGQRQQFEARRQQFEVQRQQADVQRQQADAQRQQFEAQRQQFEARRQRADGVSRWNRDNVQQSGETSRWTRDPDQRSGEASRWTRDRTVGWTQPGGDWRQRQVEQQRQWAQQRSAGGSWNRNWRNDRRYDWRDYRDRHRSTFRLGIYYDPFGYGYRSFDIGYRLVPAYYGQQYWFDPSMYGLPYPPPGTQWVRYWNDALLVDVYSGEVVDAIHNFFW